MDPPFKYFSVAHYLSWEPKFGGIPTAAKKEKIGTKHLIEPAGVNDKEDGGHSSSGSPQAGKAAKREEERRQCDAKFVEKMYGI